MTEVPEHLLKRSRDRRAALGLGGGDGGDAGGGGGQLRRPRPPTRAARRAGRRRGPARGRRPGRGRGRAGRAAAAVRRAGAATASGSRFWAMPVLAFLPLWAILYAGTLSSRASTVPTQLAAGRHDLRQPGARAATAPTGGGVGRPLSAATAARCSRRSPTSPTSSSSCGSAPPAPATPARPTATPNREGGQHTALQLQRQPDAGLPRQLTPDELLAVVRHERETFGGEKVPAEQIAARRHAAVAQRQAAAQRSTRARSAPTATPLFDDTATS